MIGKIPNDDRPRERCLTQGAGALSIKECLAIVIGSGPTGRGCLGLADEILARCLGHARVDHAFFRAIEATPNVLFEGIKGLGPAGKARLFAVVEVARRFACFRGQRVSHSKRLSNLLSIEATALRKIGSYWRNSDREWIGFVPINSMGIPDRLVVIEKGAKTHVNFDLVDFFAHLLVLRPNSMLLVHNHPSGCLDASETDIEITKKIESLAEKFDIEFLGHWIVGSTGSKKILPCWI